MNTGESGVKDANDALRAGLDLKKFLQSATRISHKQILRFSELRNQIFTEIKNPTQAAGTQSKIFPTLNKILKGHRSGEFTIITGLTGIGKTTILSHLSLDYCQQGINTLWGSFELDNIQLVKKMLRQFSGKNLELSLEEFNLWADKFEQLPLYFLRFYGTTGLDQILDAMEYAVYVYDVQHVILDNLQFMTGSQSRGWEKFEVLDEAIEKFRKFASDRRVHITLVIHPKKIDHGMNLTIHSVFGSAKATQEADSVIIIQQGPKSRYLEICKNRFDGTLGQVPYTFDNESLRYTEINTEQTQTPKQLDSPTQQPQVGKNSQDTNTPTKHNFYSYQKQARSFYQNRDFYQKNNPNHQHQNNTKRP